MKASRQDIVDNVLIIDLARDFNLTLDRVSAGNFDFRCRCPSEDHKAGNERTSSLFIDSRNNNFHCFGCSAGSSVIDFQMLCANQTFPEALEELGRKIDPSKVTGEDGPQRPDTFPALLELSQWFKKSIREHPEDRAWIDKLMRQVDNHLLEIDQFEIKQVKALLRKVRSLIQKRYG